MRLYEEIHSKNSAQDTSSYYIKATKYWMNYTIYQQIKSLRWSGNIVSRTFTSGRKKCVCHAQFVNNWRRSISCACAVLVRWFLLFAVISRENYIMKCMTCTRGAKAKALGNISEINGKYIDHPSFSSL